jgi:hypothetical protein
MPTITVDSALGAQLNQCKVPVILVDQAGRKLGQFVPEPISWRESCKADGCPYSLEELERMHNETGGRTLAEIWKEVGRE